VIQHVPLAFATSRYTDKKGRFASQVKKQARRPDRHEIFPTFPKVISTLSQDSCLSAALFGKISEPETIVHFYSYVHGMTLLRENL